MPNYTTVAGDTFEIISRKVYGEGTRANQIAAANPGVEEPLAIGVVLSVPQDNTVAPPAASASASNPDEVSLIINGERFTFWENIRVRRAIDTPDAISFSAPFEAGSAKFRDTFRPFSYPSAVFMVGGSPLFSGVVVDIAPELQPDKRSVGVSGYSLPGVVFDCPAPLSKTNPPEFDKEKLSAIAAKLCEPFGVKVVQQGDEGAVFQRVALELGKEVGSFLSDLAKQRNVVLSSTTEGALLIWQSVEPGNPVAVLNQGASPVVSVVPSFNPQKYFTSISGADPVAIGNKGGSFTVRNNFAEGLFRPYTFEAKDTENGTIKAAVEAKLGRMFAEAASYTLTVDTWRTGSGELWAPNTTLILDAPGAMIYGPYEFLIRAVTYDRSEDQETAELELVLPGSFSGKQPEALPWL